MMMDEMKNSRKNSPSPENLHQAKRAAVAQAHLNGTMAGMVTLQNLQNLANLQNLPQVASLAAGLQGMTAGLTNNQLINTPLNLTVSSSGGTVPTASNTTAAPHLLPPSSTPMATLPQLLSQPQPVAMPQFILTSGQLVQGIQGAQLLIPTSQGIATQTILTIPVSHVTNNQMVNLALSNGQVVSTTLANLQSIAQPQNMLNTPRGRANGRDILSFFVKVVPYDVPSQAEYVLDKCVFLKEKIFYRDIFPQLYHEYKDEPWTATCFLVKENLLVFEDLGVKGYSLRNMLFDKELIVSSLTSIARMHASSLLVEARLGKSLKKIYPHAFVENAFSETGKTRMWFEVSVNAIVAVAEHLGLDASLVPKACEEVYAALEMSATKRNVISHGDLWGNNMMFSNTVPPKCFLVDFQLIRYSPLAHDVVQLLYLCADRDFRGKWEEAMLKHYYSVLCEILTSTKSVSVKVPSWSELVEGMEEQRLCALITAAISFQTVLLDEKVAAEIMNNSDSYHEFEFVN